MFPVTFRIYPDHHMPHWFCQWHIIIRCLNLPIIYSAQIIYTDQMKKHQIWDNRELNNAKSEEQFSHHLSFNFPHAINHVAYLKYPRISINHKIHADRQKWPVRPRCNRLMILFPGSTALTHEGHACLLKMQTAYDTSNPAFVFARCRCIIAFVFTKEIHCWTEPTEIMKSKFLKFSGWDITPAFLLTLMKHNSAVHSPHSQTVSIYPRFTAW